VVRGDAQRGRYEMRMRKIYALPPEIQAELDAVKLEQQHAERRSSTATQLSTSGGSYRSSVTSLATSTGSAGETDSEGLPLIVQHVSDAPGDGRATAAGVAAFRRRLAVKGPSHSQVAPPSAPLLRTSLCRNPS
jgi:hypothetical protein